jgi:mRNA-degrading endonuclease RelE of RelBE toxin-antitoxin system
MKAKFNIFVPKKVKKSLLRIPMPWRERISNVVELLQYDQFLGEKMVGKLEGKRKIRVWPYRIVYMTDKKAKVIVILEISHRGNVSYD